MIRIPDIGIDVISIMDTHAFLAHLMTRIDAGHTLHYDYVFPRHYILGLPTDVSPPVVAYTISLHGTIVGGRALYEMSRLSLPGYGEETEICTREHVQLHLKTQLGDNPRFAYSFDDEDDSYAPF